MELNGLEVNIAAHAVRCEGDEVHLTPIEFKLLRVLVQNRGRWLTHNSLLQQVWGAAYTGARQMLRVHIANPRRKIEPTDGPPLIHTEYRVGYRLADAHPDGVCRMRPAGEAIDGEVAQRRARVTTKFPSRGLRVA